jgi:hypothetical protein
MNHFDGSLVAVALDDVIQVRYQAHGNRGRSFSWLRLGLPVVDRFGKAHVRFRRAELS